MREKEEREKMGNQVLVWVPLQPTSPLSLPWCRHLDHFVSHAGEATPKSGGRCNCHLTPVTRFLSLQLQSTHFNQPILLRRIFFFPGCSLLLHQAISVLDRIIGIPRFRRPVSLDSTSMEKLGQLRTPPTGREGSEVSDGRCFEHAILARGYFMMLLPGYLHPADPLDVT